MPTLQKKLSVDRLGQLIYEVRDQRVMLDRDLAKIYGVTTAALNQAMKRNKARFPADFSFQLRKEEIETLISQNVISKSSRGGRTKPPQRLPSMARCNSQTSSEASARSP